MPLSIQAEQWTDEEQTDEEWTAEEGKVSKEKTIYFPQFHPVQSVNNEAYMVYQIKGKLALSDECLRIMSGNKGYLLIWPGWYTFDIVSKDIVISNLRTGAVVAQLKLGGIISLSGGELEDRPFNLKYVIPDGCKGPYWAVGDIESVKTEAQPKIATHSTERERGKSAEAKKKSAGRSERGKPTVAALKKPGKPERSKPAISPQKPNQPGQEMNKTSAQATALPDPADEELEKSMER